MKNDKYIRLCNEMWRRHVVQGIPYANDLPKIFNRDTCPEPYVLYHARQKPRLVFLLSNPGGRMEHQKIENIRKGGSVVNSSHTYIQVAEEFGKHYVNALKGKNSGRRIYAMCELAERCDYSGFDQVECIPYHSDSLPDKVNVLKHLRKMDDYNRYVDELRRHLKNRDVLVMSSISSSRKIRESVEDMNDWLKYLTWIAGIDVARSDIIDIIIKNGKTTGALIVDGSQEAKKAMWLMMGSNGLPAEQGRIQIANAFRRISPL